MVLEYSNRSLWLLSVRVQSPFHADSPVFICFFFPLKVQQAIRSIPSDRSANEDHMLPSLSTKCRVMRCDAQNVIHSCLLPGYRRALLKLRSPSSGLLLGCWTRQKHWKLTRKAGETGCHDIAAHHMSSFSIKHEAERALWRTGRTSSVPPHAKSALIRDWKQEQTVTATTVLQKTWPWSWEDSQPVNSRHLSFSLRSLCVRCRRLCPTKRSTMWATSLRLTTRKLKDKDCWTQPAKLQPNCEAIYEVFVLPKNKLLLWQQETTANRR